MTTIGEFVARNRRRNSITRLEKLRNLNAPQVIIDNEEKQSKMSDAELIANIGKINEYGNLLFSEVYVGVGKGGKQYLRFEVGGGKALMLVTGPYNQYFYETKEPSKSKLTRIA